MFKRFGLILSLAIGMVLLAVLPALAETLVDTAWVRRYNGPSDSSDVATAIAVDDSGYVYVTGRSRGSGTSNDYLTIKYYPDGDTAWMRRYNGPANSGDWAYDIAVDDSGYVYVTGYSEASVSAEDWATIKYYPNGDTVWVRRYNGPGNDDDEAWAMVVDDSGCVYVTGYCEGTGGNPDLTTIKYLPNGDTAWVRIYNGPGNHVDWARALTIDASYNVYVTGKSAGSGTSSDYVTIKYNPEGDTVWLRRYDGPDNSTDDAYAICVDDSGYVYVTGSSRGTGTNADYATIKYDADGDTVWVRRYNGPGNYLDHAYAIALDGLYNVYVTGTSYDTAGHLDYVTIKYAPDGDTLWLRRYKGPGEVYDEAYAMAIDNSGNAYVTGKSAGSGTHYDYATIVYAPNGDTVWVRRYNGTGNDGDIAKAIAVDDSGNVYVTGSSNGIGTMNDYVTIKYFPKPSDVKDEVKSGEKPSAFALSQNYPNPFNQTTKIEFTLAKSSFVSLNIYDILGRKVRTLVSEHVSSGYKSVLWDGKNDSGKDVASGIYFYQMKVEDPASGGVGNFSETKKLVLLK